MKHIWKVLLVLLMIQPAWAVTVTTKAQFLAELPLTPGKTITVSNQTITGAGDWGAITITGDCTQANPCVIESATPQGVIFSGNDAGNFCLAGAWYTFSGFRWTGQTGFGSYGGSGGCTDDALVTFDGAQNVTVDDIQIDNISGGGVPIAWMELNGGRDTRDTTLSNSIISGWTQTGSAAIYIYARGNRGYPYNINITNVTLEDRTVTDTSSNNKYWLRIGNSQDSIDTANYPNAPNNHANVVITNMTLRNDVTAGNGQDAFHIKSQGMIIQDSTFENFGRIKNRQGDDWIVRRNTFKNPLETDGLYMYNDGHTIANNLFYTTTGKARGLTLGKGNTDVNGDGRLDYYAFSNGIIIGNTFDGFNTAAIEATRNSTGNNDGKTTVDPSNITYHNNAIRQTNGTMFDGPGGCSIFTAISHNAYTGAAAKDCHDDGTNNVAAVFLWVDPANGDYQPGDGSPLIDAGTAVAGTTEDNTDHDNKARSGNPDIGAFETPPTPPPVGQCDTIYGGVTDYTLCAESETTCKFNVTLSGSDCDTLCGSFNRDCVAAYDNNPGSCVELGTDTCATTRTDEICECDIAISAPPAGGTTLTQVHYRMYGALAEHGGQALTAEDLPGALYVNSRFNLTIAVAADASTIAQQRDLALYYSHNGGAYTLINSVCTGNPTCLIDNPDRTSGASTTVLLSLDGRIFLDTSHYVDTDDPDGGDNIVIDFEADEQVELTFAIGMGSTVSATDTLAYRIYNGDGTALNTYSVTPSVTVGSGRFIRSGGQRQ